MVYSISTLHFVLVAIFVKKIIMQVTRSFGKVGQALFSVERKGNVVIVYDCGFGAGMKNKIGDVIKNLIKPEERVKALFISHYDKDHINGVQELLNYCNVEHLFLPLVPCFRVLLFLTTLNRKTNLASFLENLLDNAQNANLGDTKVHYVGMEDGNQAGSLLFNNDLPGVIPSNSEIRLDGGEDWIYKPYNRKLMTDEECNVFLDKLKELHPGAATDINTYVKCTECDWNGLMNVWRNHDLKLKEALIKAKIVKSDLINSYSMTLYSGSKNTANGCLYTGDYDAGHNMDELKMAYGDLWDNISIIQVPHHGSCRNFSNGLIKDNAEYVISNKDKPYRGGQVDPTCVINILSAAKKTCHKTYNKDVTLTNS